MLNRINKIRRRYRPAWRGLIHGAKKHRALTAFAVVFVLAALAGGVVWADHAANVRASESAKRQDGQAAAEHLTLEEQQRITQEQSRKERQQDSDGATQSPAEQKKDGPKYSISSDPRSTAYSTTPPPPNPASFNTRITRAGQLAYGDKMYYNATKNETGYYGGDLVLSPASVTISRSGSKKAPITVSSYNGKSISMPSMPWDEQNPHFFIAVQGLGVLPSASSYNMIVDTYNMPAAGSYKLHIVSGCSDFGNDGCESHGFITVNVVD